MRTDHGYLRSYLSRIPGSRFNSPQCNCGRATQTPEHLLIECSLYSKERDQLTKGIRRKKLELHWLLHTKPGMERARIFLETTNIATRSWLYQAIPDMDEDDPTDNRWRAENVGWGRLLQ